MKIIKIPESFVSPHSKRKRGLVATMGALHEGHLSLIRAMRNQCDEAVVSIFVNPLQFTPHEDFKAYPRTLESDLALCEQAGVDIVFCPDIDSMYPEGFQTRVLGGELKTKYCGQTRPVFFDGVLTVVHILFQIVRPQISFWGEKDYQQLYLVQRMVRDFWMPIEIVPMPTIRESSGLALSSRNVYLSKEQKEEATCLFRALLAVQEALRCQNRSVEDLLKLARRQITLEIDYLNLVSIKTLESLCGLLNEPARLLMAAYTQGSPRVRLIDNGQVVL